VRLPVIDRDYVAEVGYLTRDQRWLGIARSTPVRMPVGESLDAVPKSNPLVGDGSRIMILPAPPQRRIEEVGRPHPQAYVYWDIAESRRTLLRRQGGNMLVLRIYDANHINLDHQAPHHTYEYVLDENARDITVPVPMGDRDYVAEIGYLTIGGKFLSLGRSLYATIPALKTTH
jgi:phosphate transport system substrate-binding protein